ncbi:MAG: SMP-30/gluconolactonase/LRE family protein, partial [Alphaproteobacteria bacterium]|nr:SMP-30/gluconolactonase/LRE family protein [Alphaproteobacteria bacterium]
MSVEVRDDRFRAVVGDDVEFEELGSGFDFTEGPIWHPHEKYLIFSDMPGNHMRRWSAADGITTFRQPSNMANGNAWDREGCIVTCEHATSAVSRTEADGSISVLATHYGDRELNSPNDIIVKSDGAIYFS